MSRKFHSMSVRLSALLLSGALAGCGGPVTETPEDPPIEDPVEVVDAIAPSLASSMPAANASDVSKSTVVSLTFSEPMNPLSLVVTLEPTLELGAAVWSQNDTVATFTAPVDQLIAGESYVLTVNAADKAANPLPQANIGFTVKADADVLAPTVVSSAPAADALAVALNAGLAIEFSEAMNQASVDAAVSIAPPVAGTVSWDASGSIRTLAPSAPLTANTVYTVTVAAGFKDLAGNAQSMAHVFSFTTAAAADSTPPVIASASPASTATGVARNANIQLTFSEAMDKAATQAAFSITAPLGYGTGTFSWSADGKTMTFNPGPNFGYGQAITWRVTTAAKDLAGNALAQEISRGFLVIRQGTLVLDSVAAVDGTVQSNGTVDSSTGDAYSGDNASNHGYRVFLSFDLSALPADTQRITLANLYVYLASKMGDPMGSLGGAAVLERVAYGATLQASAYSVARFTGFGDSSTFISTDTAGWKLSSQLAFGVGDDWTNRAIRGSRTQFRIRMPTEFSDNTTSDALKMRSGNSLLTSCPRTALGASGSSCKPYLVVTYEYP